MLKTDELKVVNPMPFELMSAVQEAIRAVEEESNPRKWGNSRDILSKRPFVKYLAKGACGFVYQLCEDYILKVNDVGTNFSLDRLKDGQIMEALQGLPFIPTLYAYTPDNKYIVMQRIKGGTTGDFRWNEKMQEKYRPKEFDTDMMFEMAKELYTGALERGWVLKDLHGENTMVSPEGFFVVDVGLFKTTEQEPDGATEQLNSLLWDLERIGRKIGAPESSKNPSQVMSEFMGRKPLKPTEGFKFNFLKKAKTVTPETDFSPDSNCNCTRCVDYRDNKPSSTSLSWLLSSCTTEPESKTLSSDFTSSLFTDEGSEGYDSELNNPAEESVSTFSWSSSCPF